jgi:hypothetical protein
MMANKIRFKIPERDLEREDIELKVTTGGTFRGTLHISKGTLVWRSPKKRDAGKRTWQELIDFMRESPVRGKP